MPGVRSRKKRFRTTLIAIVMKVVIIGSGFAGITFAEKLKALNPDARITVVTRESDGFYSRPLLSHGFSKDGIEQSIILKSFEAIRQKGIEILTETEAKIIDRHHKIVNLSSDGSEQRVDYDVLVLAQGSAAFIPPAFAADSDNFYLLNSLADLKKLRRLRQTFLDQGKTPHWAIIGGGLIGCEVASDLAVAGDKISLFHAMDRLMERQLCPDDSQNLHKVMKDIGVKVLLNQSINGIDKKDGEILVNSNNSGKFDAALVSCGFKPRIELAAAAGLSVNRGIKVNSFMQTNDPAIFAIGDVAELPNGKLYAFILPIRGQAQWLAEYLVDEDIQPWIPPDFKPKSKVHGFTADNPKFF